MFTHKDIEMRSIFVVNCVEHKKSLCVYNGELMLEEFADGKTRTLTRFPFQKLLALFVIGHMTITTPIIDKCKRFGVALIVVKPNLRPVFYWADSAEANYLLHKRQYDFSKDDASIGKILIKNKIMNQLSSLIKTRKKDEKTLYAIDICNSALDNLPDIDDNNQLMGLEGLVSKYFFSAYFQSYNWKGRCPRVKTDILNTTLDIGYSILFNYIECFARLFGFDLYVGVYHRLWFKRKSLICDLIEPFRCIIDHATLLAFNRKQFSERDFLLVKKEYHLKHEKSSEYYQVFFEALILFKTEIFKYIQGYYRCFMGRKSIKSYPIFKF